MLTMTQRNMLHVHVRLRSRHYVPADDDISDCIVQQLATVGRAGSRRRRQPHVQLQGSIQSQRLGSVSDHVTAQSAV